MESDLCDLAKDCLRVCREQEKYFRNRWIESLKDFPELIRYCPCINDFTHGEWAVLLSHQPEFFKLAPIDDFTLIDWYLVLTWQSQFIGYCPCVDEFNELQKELLVKNNPHLVNYFASADSSSKK